MANHRCGLFIYVSLVVFVPVLDGQVVRSAIGDTRYAVVSQLPLARNQNQIDGKLQILEDARLTPQLRKMLWGTGGDMQDDDPARSVFKSDPPHNAQVRIVTNKGTIVETSPLERPLAKLSRTLLYGTPRPTYLVTVDYSAGFGSYNGPVTLPLEVQDGRLHWLEATDSATGKKEQIELMQSLKTTWKIVDSASKTGKEILHAACRPDDFSSTSNDFTLTYTRYYFSGSDWMRIQKKQPGFSEFEDGFPRRELFP